MVGSLVLRAFFYKSNHTQEEKPLDPLGATNGVGKEEPPSANGSEAGGEVA